MGRKKKKPVKPWCWYCNREFDDDKILIQHQRAKHYKCPFCHKKLYSGPGLTVHCIQVHKETLDKIPEALPNRNSVDIDIYGMQGIPEEDVREHERLKRGDDGSTQSQGSNQSQQQQQRQQTQQQIKSQPPITSHNSAMTAMHAAMFQHAMGMGAMPPGFPMPPVLPPGFMPPGFMPPGFPPMPMHPGIPPPPLGYPPLLPTAAVPNPLAPHLGFPPPPPGPTPSTSGAVPPPPPLSGVGHLIGIPAPSYPAPPLPPTSQNSNRFGLNQSKGSQDKGQPERQQQSYRSQTAPTANSKEREISPLPPASKSVANNSSTTISKPAATISGVKIEKSDSEFDSFILIPGSKSRIMHPNKDLSLEEMRLCLNKYRVMVDKLKKESPTVKIENEGLSD